MKSIFLSLLPTHRQHLRHAKYRHEHRAKNSNIEDQISSAPRLCLYNQQHLHRISILSIFSMCFFLRPEPNKLRPPQPPRTRSHPQPGYQVPYYSATWDINAACSRRRSPPRDPHPLRTNQGNCVPDNRPT